MGATNTKYLSELSDDSSDDSESSYTMESARCKKLEESNPDNPSDIVHMTPGIDVENSSNATISDGLDTLRDLPKFKEFDLTTDAVLKPKEFPKPEDALNLDRVLSIEDELEEYELVSMVYLLYDEAHIAHQELIMWLRGAAKRPLYSWASNARSHGVPWENKLVEALCVIKNYQILKKLGYDKFDVKMHFLPHRVNSITSLRRLRKAGYILCENLDYAKTNMFLEQVRLYFLRNNLQFEKYDWEYLELHLLKWETMRFITSSDFGNIKKILKEMNEEFLYSLFDSNGVDQKTEVKKTMVPPENYVVKTDEVKVAKARQTSTSIDTHLRPSNTYIQQEYTTSPLSSPSIGQDNSNAGPDFQDSDHRYFIDPQNPGVILIINEEEFYTEIQEKFKHLLPTDADYKLESRQGTERDRDDLEKVFKRMGFRVIVKNNLTHEDMLTKIKEVVSSVKDESSLFICVLSHGDKGVVYGSNSCKVKVSTIQEIIWKTNRANLAEKPKVLILQSCQGKQCQKLDEDSEEESEDQSMTTDGPGSSKQSVPRTADMFTFWATVPGFAAIRSKRTGSWFIQSLCQKIEEIGNRYHFADICTRIVGDVTSKKWIIHEKDKNAMVPMQVTTLRKSLYLPPLRDE